MSVLDARTTGQAEGGASFPLRHRLFRLVWGITWLLLARWTPPLLHRWRRWLLNRFGARVAPGARVYGTARIWYPPNLVMERYATIGPGANCYNQDRIVIGERAIVSQGAVLCAGTHDVRDPDFQLVIRPVVIGARAWVAMEAFVGPGVTVGEGAVLGARGVAMRDLDPWWVHTGNPAVPIRTREMRPG